MKSSKINFQIKVSEIICILHRFFGGEIWQSRCGNFVVSFCQNQERLTIAWLQIDLKVFRVWFNLIRCPELICHAGLLIQGGLCFPLKKNQHTKIFARRKVMETASPWRQKQSLKVINLRLYWTSRRDQWSTVIVLLMILFCTQQLDIKESHIHCVRKAHWKRIHGFRHHRTLHVNKIALYSFSRPQNQSWNCLPLSHLFFLPVCWGRGVLRLKKLCLSNKSPAGFRARESSRDVRRFQDAEVSVFLFPHFFLLHF